MAQPYGAHYEINMMRVGEADRAHLNTPNLGHVPSRAVRLGMKKERLLMYLPSLDADN